eukprot:TRINITY_DN4035_c0_g2_i2.p1 TRINITY_DN4035_c0_g2~~TRINITY_DN4035_c0_g2_i2.p1  ORF type:complete len:195 (+),score=21.42 TRINITY_DN4035_c0_g2_i2:188-772(+)
MQISPQSQSEQSIPLEWPDLCIDSCSEPSELILSWGQCSPNRHRGVTRIEVELTILSFEDLRGFSLAERWRSASEKEADTAEDKDSELIFTFATTSELVASIAGKDRNQRACRTHRMPAHSAGQNESAKLKLAGLSPGVILSVRLRAWQRREGRWGPHGSALILHRRASSIEVSSPKDLLGCIRAIPMQEKEEY